MDKEKFKNFVDEFGIQNVVAITIVILALIISLIFALTKNINKTTIPTDLAENTLNSEQTVSEKESTTTGVTEMSADEILSLIDSYQSRYFEIIRRNDVLLDVYGQNSTAEDLEALEGIYREVTSKISNQDYLAKYDAIEEQFANNTGETTVGMNEFASQHYDAIDGLLNEVYQQIKRKIPQEDFKKLTTSEIKWIKDVGNYESVFESQGFGSNGTVIKLNYEINMRGFRTLLLMLYL